MAEPTRWDERYNSGDIPWDTGRPDSHLVRLVTERPIRACRALELGCGTGTNAVWLAQQGFDVTAVEISEPALAMARKTVAEAGVAVETVLADCVKDDLPGGPFAFAFDRGCFHSFDLPQERTAVVENVFRHLADGGLWLSLLGSADAPPRETGPPMRSAGDIAAAVEPRFEILRLEAIHFDSDRPNPPPAWACLMRKRAPGL